MKLLLDTCSFLWMIDSVEQLSSAAREALEASSNELFLHQASALEIQIKYQTGKLGLRCSPKELIAAGLRQHGIHYSPLENEEIWQLQKLPFIHRDPFDRLIISAALCRGMRVVTPDPQIHKYPVPVIW